MAAPGWYPDPAGTPHTLRYWDGGSWTAQTMDGPTSPPPGPESTPEPTPEPFPGFAPAEPTDTVGMGRVPDGGFDESSGRRGGRVALVAALALVLVATVAALTVWGVQDVREPSAERGPQSSPAPQSDQPTERPSTEPPSSGPSPRGDAAPACVAGSATRGGTPPSEEGLRGGDLELPLVPGFRLVGGGGAFTFADGVSAVARQVEESWIAVYALGSVPIDDGAPLEETAETVLECMSSSPDIYSGFSGRTDLDSAAIEVDGRDAWSLSAEIRVDDPEVTVEGDVARVVVVDTGDPDAYSLFVSVVPIGNRKLITQQEGSVDRLSLAGGRSL